MTTLTGTAHIKGWIRWAAVGGLVCAGCAGPATMVGARAADIRGNAAVAGHEARPLVAGPIRLLHINSDSREAPRFSRVWRRDGAVGDCRNATPLTWDGQSEVEVAKDELVCVAAERPARFSWHGRWARGSTLPSAPRQASLR